MYIDISFVHGLSKKKKKEERKWPMPSRLVSARTTASSVDDDQINVDVVSCRGVCRGVACVSGWLSMFGGGAEKA